MSDDPQLTGKLDALIQDATFEDGAMVVGPAGTPETTEGMLQAIDVTMLPRDLIFAVGASFITLAVSGKRVRQVTEASADVPTDGFLGQALDTEDSAGTEALAAALQALNGLKGNLTLKRLPMAAAIEAGAAGIGRGSLGKLLQPEMPHLESSISTVMGDLYEVLLGYAQIEGKTITPVKGDATLAEAFTALEGTWAKVSAEHQRLRTGTDADTLITLDGVLPEGALAHFVTFKGSQVVIATSAGSLAQVAQTWARASG